MCVALTSSGVAYRCPLGQTVEVGVQRRGEHVQVEWVDITLQPITDLVESGRHTQTQGTLYSCIRSAHNQAPAIGTQHTLGRCVPRGNILL